MGNVPQQLGGLPAFAGNAHGDAVGVCVETHGGNLIDFDMDQSSRCRLGAARNQCAAQSTLA